MLRSHYNIKDDK